jgi:WD40 repeat protein
VAAAEPLAGVPLPADFCPYKGLAPYTAEDEAYFFGRATDREIIISNLYGASLTVFYGASGAGKSSVLLAGVMPRLRATPGVAAIAFREWQGDDFLERLRTRIIEATESALGASVIDSSRGLLDLLTACSSAIDGPMFVILDQFEEYFLYHGRSDAGQKFDAELVRAINRRGLDVNFMFSMREDELSKLDRYQGRVMHLLGNLLRLDHLDAAGASEAMRGPLEEFGRDRRRAPDLVAPRTIEDELVETLQRDLRRGHVSLVEGGPGNAEPQSGSVIEDDRIETPLLQLVLTRLWHEETRAGSSLLRLETYRSLGGAGSIARTHLNETMDRLSSSERELAASLFRFLVTPSGAKIAQESGALSAWTEQPVGAIDGVLNRLAAPDMRILRRIQLSGQPERFELFHDVLAPALLDWRRRDDERRTYRRRMLQLRRAALLIGSVALILGAVALFGVTSISYQQGIEVNLAREQDARLAAETARADADAQRLAAETARTDADAQRVAAEMAAATASTALGEAKRNLDAVTAAQATAIVAQATAEENVRLAEESAAQATMSSIQAAKAEAERDTAKQEKDALERFARSLVLTANDGAVYFASFSPDGTRIASAGQNGITRVWEAASGRAIGELVGHTERVYSVAYNSDGTRLVTAGVDRTARVWDASSALELLPPLAHPDRVLSAVFSPDNATIATACADRLVRIWNAGDGALIAMLRGHSDIVNTVAFSRDGQLLVSASDDDTARIWRREGTQWQQATPPLQHSDAVTSAAFSSNAGLIVTSDADRTAYIWDGNGGLLGALPGHTDRVISAAFSPDDTQLATASADGTARAWDTASLAMTADLRGHTDRVYSAFFSPDSGLIVTASRDGTVRVWGSGAFGQPDSTPIDDGLEKGVPLR